MTNDTLIDSGFLSFNGALVGLGCWAGMARCLVCSLKLARFLVLGYFLDLARLGGLGYYSSLARLSTLDL
jgi:hypothetical protein